jgi:APA family basic amino acid/polyamine antiporter
VIGLTLVFDPDLLVSQVDLGVVPSWGDFALGIAVGMVAYTGIETISNMAEEARDSARTIPRGTALTVLAVVGIYAFLPAIALSAMPVTQGAGGEFTTELGTTYADDPVLGIVQNLGLATGLTDVLEVYVGVLAAVILLIATNAALIGLSRLTFSMGVHRQLPELLRQVHPTFKTPYVAIIVFSGVAALVMAPGETTFLGAIYAFGATLSFTVAHVSVIRLRQKRPLAERPPDRDGNPPWSPLGNFWIGGVQMPITAVVGGMGTFAAFVVAMVLDPVILATGGGWMIAGMALYIAYRRHQGLPLRETRRVDTLTPLGVEEVEYRSVLVAFDEEAPFSEETVATAKALAARRRRAIHVLSLVTIPSHLPLDAEVPERERAAQTKIEQAKLICGQRLTGHVEHVREGQAGPAIVDEAVEIKAAAIVLQLRYRDGVPLYGKTVQTVLAKRPCRVIVSANPAEHGAAAELTGVAPA